MQEIYLGIITTSQLLYLSLSLSLHDLIFNRCLIKNLSIAFNANIQTGTQVEVLLQKAGTLQRGDETLRVSLTVGHYL